MKSWKSIPLLFTVLLILFSSSSFGYQYYGTPNSNPQNAYKLIGGISSGYYANYASNVYFQGTYYQLQGAALGAYSIWKSDTEFNMDLLPSGSVATSKIGVNNASLGADFKYTYGFTYFYRNGQLIMGLNGGPTQNWDRASVFLNLDGIHHYGMSFTEYRALAIHEVGHALGLNHENYQPSVMRDGTGFLSGGYYIPQADDINGINTLY